MQKSLYEVIEELRREQNVSSEVAKATIIKVWLKDAIEKKAEKLAKEFNVPIIYKELPPETPMAYSHPAGIEIDPQDYAWAVCERVQDEPRLDWDTILETEFHHEIGHRVLIEKLGRFAPRDRLEEIIAHLVTHRWIDHFFLPPELRETIQLIIETDRRKLSIPQLRKQLQGTFEEFIEAIYLILSHFSADEIKELFPEIPELAELRKMIDAITSPQDVRRVYDQVVRRWRELQE